MPRTYTFRIIFPSLTISLLVFLLIGCDGGGDDGGSPIEESEPDIRSGRVCTDEYGLAFSYSTLGGEYDTSVPALWDGTPFVVDVSSSLPEPYRVLDVIRREAELLHHVLGYPLIVAGEVLPLSDQYAGYLDGVHPHELDKLPPAQRIEVLCCVAGAGPGIAGLAYPWLRQILVGDIAHQVIVHELYHILGLAHSSDRGVPMSDSLSLHHAFYDPRQMTRSSDADWANLACIYD